MTIIRVVRGQRPLGAGSVSTKVLSDTLTVSDVVNDILRLSRVGTDSLVVSDGVVEGSSTAPFIYATDFTSGPTSGGENSKGCYLTIYLYNAGNFSDYGTTNFVTIGGQAVDNYRCLESVRAVHMAALGLKRLTVQIGSTGVQGLTAGTAYAVSVTVAGVSPSNATASGKYLTPSGKSITFTPQPGAILFVDTSSGNNANAGTIASPLQDLQTTAGSGGAFKINSSVNATDGIKPGTHVIVRGNTSSRNGLNSRCVDLFRVSGRAATGATDRGSICLTSYPGAAGANSPELFIYQSSSGSGGMINGNDSTRAEEVTTSYGGATGWCQYMEFSNLKAVINAGTGGDGGPFNTQNHGQFWRITNCEMTWPSTVTGANHGRSAGIEGSPVDSFFALNYIHDIYGDSNEENHGIYMDGYSGTGECAAIRNEYAGNYIVDITHGTGIQFYGGVSNADLSGNDVYDNMILRTGKYGLNWNTAVKSGRAWNNVIAHTDDHAIVIDTTSLTSGNFIYMANNVIYDWGTGTADRFAILKNSTFGGTFRFENNIVALPSTHANNNADWWTNNAGGGTMTFVKNRWDDRAGNLVAKPSQDSTGSFGNPSFTNAASNDFSLANGSACIDAGNVPTGITRSYGFGALVVAPTGAAHDQGAFERAA